MQTNTWWEVDPAEHARRAGGGMLSHPSEPSLRSHRPLKMCSDLSSVTINRLLSAYPLRSGDPVYKFPTCSLTSAVYFELNHNKESETTTRVTWDCCCCQAFRNSTRARESRADPNACLEAKGKGCSLRSRCAVASPVHMMPDHWITITAGP